MKIRNIPHLIGQGFVSFWRNGVMTTAAILVLICCMLVLGAFYAVIDNLNNFLDEQIDDIKTINAYVHSSSQTEIAEKEALLIALMEKEGSNIDSYVHITKQEKLHMMMEEADEVFANILKKFDNDSNPIPEIYDIHFKDFDGVQQLMRNLEEIFGTDNVESDADIYKTVTDISSTATFIGICLMAILLFIAVLIIMTTIKLTVFARRKDIAIMRYIGATSSFVVAPFIVEGVIIGIVSTIISCGLQFYLYTQVVADIFKNRMSFNLVPVGDYFPILPLAFLAIGLFAGVTASAISVKKHLDV